LGSGFEERPVSHSDVSGLGTLLVQVEVGNVVHQVMFVLHGLRHIRRWRHAFPLPGFLFGGEVDSLDERAVTVQRDGRAD
jgi:hypothetical protein